MKLSHRNILIWSAELLILYIAALLFLCLANFGGMDVPPRLFLNIPTDKIVHFLMFAPFPVIAWLFIKARIRSQVKWFRMLVVLFVAGGLLALLTETLQGMTDYRSKDYFDALADMVGVLIGCIIVLIIRKPYDRLLEKVKTAGDKVA